MKIEPTVLERFCDYEVYLQQSTP
ncbi:MAG: hypothetical protein JWO53_119, partial [Chlamydiia bacterium]|nr:hypothetical protein [Chlamydiia bacterium]